MTSDERKLLLLLADCILVTKHHIQAPADVCLQNEYDELVQQVVELADELDVVSVR